MMRTFPQAPFSKATLGLNLLIENQSHSAANLMPPIKAQSKSNSSWQSHKSSVQSVPVKTSIDGEESNWMALIANGSEAALRKLISRWHLPLINFFHRHTGNQSDAEDLTQTVFIKIYRASSRYEAKAKFSTYLFHIARRVLLNHYRSQNRKPLTPMDPQNIPEELLVAQTPISKNEVEESFQNILDALPENQRTAVLLRVQQELSYEEIAITMKASVSSVKTWIHRARQNIKSELQADT